MRIIAVDWSGSKTGEQRKIALAEVDNGRLVRVENGRGRAEVCEHLVSLALESPDLVVGFDFAFSLPDWFLDSVGAATAPELWALAAEHAEAWLAAKAPPFWGGGRGPWPRLPEHYRLSDMLIGAVGGIRPKSVFQVGGAGAVGTGSLRGLPVLHRLHQAGFHVWPFERARLPLVVELWPRVLTGPVVKSSAVARRAYVQAIGDAVPETLRHRVAADEDAFDAAVSALVMSAYAADLLALPLVVDRRLAREGIIWYPGWQGPYEEMEA